MENREMRSGEKNRDAVGWLVLAAVFLLIFLFYTVAHPLILSDNDDWRYVAYTRSALPLWGDWNPTRVMPEIMMSGVNTAGVLCLMPLIGDYQTCITVSSAAAVGAAAAVYVFAFYQMMRKKYGQSAGNALFLSALFLILHFVVFRTNNRLNDYLLHNTDLTFYFYYTIPALNVFSMIMFLSTQDKTVLPWSDRQVTSRGLLILALYLLLLSNLFQSGMLALWFAFAILRDVCGSRGEKRPFRRLLEKNIVKAVFILLWLAVLVFESSGGRAASLASDEPLSSRVAAAFSSAFQKLSIMHAGFIVFVAAGLLLSILYAAFAGREDRKTILAEMGLNFAMTLLAFVFVVLLCAETVPGNAYTVRILLCPFFFLFLTVFSGLGRLFKGMPKAALVLPLTALIMLAETASGLRTFWEATGYKRIDTSYIVAINQSIIDQAVAADKGGLSEVTISVPRFDADGNWPMPAYMGDSVASALYKHGILRNNIRISIQIDPALSETYHLP